MVILFLIVEGTFYLLHHFFLDAFTDVGDFFISHSHDFAGGVGSG